jgi:hypothetical protein
MCFMYYHFGLNLILVGSTQSWETAWELRAGNWEKTCVEYEFWERGFARVKKVVGVVNRIISQERKRRNNIQDKKHS